MKKHLIILLCSIVILTSITALAEETDDGTRISLDSALEMALNNNLEYKIALEEQKISREKVNESWGILFPSINSEASLTRQYSENGIMSTSDGQYDIKIIQVQFGVNPGSFYNSLQMSRKGYKTSTEKVRKIKNDITYSVIKSYFDVLITKEMIDLRKTSITFLEENLKNVENQYKTGTVPKYDLLHAKVKLQSEKPNLIEAENNHRVAIDYFNYVIGLERSEYISDNTTLERSVRPVPKNNANNRIDLLTTQAMKNRPEIVMLQQKKESAEDKGDIYQSMYLWPVITFGGYYGYTKNMVKEKDTSNVNPAYAPLISEIYSGIIGDDRWHENWQVRIAATYRWGSIIPLDSNKAKERAADREVKKAELELSQLKRSITISVKSSYYKLIASYEKMQAHKENVQTAQEGLRIAKESFRAGVIKNSDLLAAQVSLTRAKTGYIHAMNDYYVSLAKLQKETGLTDDSLILQGE